ncbi:hypothetical protein ACFY7H_03055 [Streptomyces sp. NPDC012794]|uniref:hypothetical protein n=1 Tax=Streptomyces sp. NPDC012794 TaxID=3364850 RepID=UPI0036B9A07A
MERPERTAAGPVVPAGTARAAAGAAPAVAEGRAGPAGSGVGACAEEAGVEEAQLVPCPGCGCA